MISIGTYIAGWMDEKESKELLELCRSFEVLLSYNTTHHITLMYSYNLKTQGKLEITLGDNATFKIKDIRYFLKDNKYTFLCEIESSYIDNYHNFLKSQGYIHISEYKKYMNLCSIDANITTEKIVKKINKDLNTILKNKEFNLNKIITEPIFKEGN